MLEIRDGKKILTTPVNAEDLADIQVVFFQFLMILHCFYLLEAKDLLFQVQKEYILLVDLMVEEEEKQVMMD